MESSPRGTRATFYFAFVGAAVLVAGIFGAVHDQISYSVSPEYFTKFKFEQFRLLNPSVPERLRAAEVGFLASWWMGVPLGLLSGLAGFIHKEPSRMKRALSLSLFVIVGFAMCFALGGLAYGYHQTAQIRIEDYSDWYLPADVVYAREFLCAGHMHNAAYIGGALAIPVAWLFHFLYASATGKK